MDSIIYVNYGISAMISAVDRHFSPRLSLFSHANWSLLPPRYYHRRRRHFTESLRLAAAVPSFPGTTNFVPPKGPTYTVGDFMTRKDDLHVVTTSTTVEEALESLVEKRITGFPVVDDEWKLIGVVSDYDLLALDSISGGSQADTNLFPDVDSTWKALKNSPYVFCIFVLLFFIGTLSPILLDVITKTFSELQILLGKTKGKVVDDLMTPSPLVVHEGTNLEDAARLLLETKYRRLPVVDADGKLVGIITRGDVVRAALQIKHASEQMR